MNIPPKYSKTFKVDSSSSDPHLSGPLEIRLSADGVSIRWAGENTWREIAWYEIGICAEAPGFYKQIIEAWKIQAFEEGLADGVRTASMETNVLNYADELKEAREQKQLKEALMSAKSASPHNAG
jgi:hypothetical protein